MRVNQIFMRLSKYILFKVLISEIIPNPPFYPIWIMCLFIYTIIVPFIKLIWKCYFKHEIKFPLSSAIVNIIKIKGAFIKRFFCYLLSLLFIKVGLFVCLGETKMKYVYFRNLWKRINKLLKNDGFYIVKLIII